MHTNQKPIQNLMEKTVKASIIGLTKGKRELLDYEYANYQWWMIFGIDNGLLSAFKSFKGHKQKVVKYKDYPLPIQARFIRDWFRERQTKLTKNWFACGTCTYQDNADRNGAFNIAQRGSSYRLESGVNAFARKSLFIKDEGTSTYASACGDL